MANWGLALAKGLGMAVQTENTRYAEQIKENRIIAKQRYNKQVEEDDASFAEESAYRERIKKHLGAKSEDGKYPKKNNNAISRIMLTRQAIEQGYTGAGVNTAVDTMMEEQKGKDLDLSFLGEELTAPKYTPSGWQKHMAETKRGPLSKLMGEGINSLFSKDSTEPGATPPATGETPPETPPETPVNYGTSTTTESTKMVQTGVSKIMKGQTPGSVPFQAFQVEGMAGDFRRVNGEIVPVQDDAIDYTPKDPSEVTAKSFGTMADPDDLSKRMSVAFMSDGTVQATGKNKTIPEGYIDTTGLPEATDQATVTRQVYYRHVVNEDGETEVESRTVLFQGKKIFNEDGKTGESLDGWFTMAASAPKIPEDAKTVGVTSSNVRQYTKDDKPFIVDMRGKNPVIFGTDTPFDMVGAVETGLAPFPEGAEVSDLTLSEPWIDQVTNKTVTTYMTKDLGRVFLEGDQRVPVPAGWTSTEEARAGEQKGKRIVYHDIVGNKSLVGIELTNGDVIDPATRKVMNLGPEYMATTAVDIDKPMSAAAEKLNLIHVLRDRIVNTPASDVQTLATLNIQLSTLVGQASTAQKLALDQYNAGEKSRAALVWVKSSIDNIDNITSLATAGAGGINQWASSIADNLYANVSGVLGSRTTVEEMQQTLKDIDEAYNKDKGSFLTGGMSNRASTFKAAYDAGKIESYMTVLKYSIAHTLKGKGQKLNTDDLKRMDTLFGATIGSEKYASALQTVKQMLIDKQTALVIDMYKNRGGTSSDIFTAKTKSGTVNYWKKVRDVNGQIVLDNKGEATYKRWYNALEGEG
tara:strand:+ start:3768 stop:6188 length:2421 start_codon:yes stop_codon:yes gene_type:complete